jgi:hypothetical protein
VEYEIPSFVWTYNDKVGLLLTLPTI